MLYSSESVVRALSWSADDHWIAFEENEDVFLLDLETHEARTRVASPAYEGSPSFSIDGRWLAYVSDESGREEVYVVPVARSPEKWQISSGGGSAPRWGPGGGELFFLGLDSQLQVVEIGLGRDALFGPAEPLFEVPEGLSSPAAARRGRYAPGPDGRILVRAPVSAAAPRASGWW